MVTLRNGKTVKGRIVSSDEHSVTVYDGIFLTRINRHQIGAIA